MGNTKIKLKENLKKFLCKITETVDNLKNNIKKGELVIYAIALMLVAAGYFNYTEFKNKTVETYSEDITNVSNHNIGDAILVSNNEVEEKINNEIDDQEIIKAEENKDVSSNEILDESNYYASTKLDRDKMYAQIIASYEQLLNNTNVSEVQKSIVAEEITKINNTKNAIMICENLILTKGFENCVILINDDSVNIVVSIENGLNAESIAKIQNIVSRELGTQIENIHIMEK